MLKKFLIIKDFLTKGIWSINHSDFSQRKIFLVKALRILLISIRGVYEDKIQQRAAALTLYSLLSVVPVLALGFAIAKGFGYDQYLKGQVTSYFEQKVADAKNLDPDNSANINYYEVYEQIAKQLISFADAMLAKTKGGLVAIIGLVLLFWAVMKVLGNIESSFNDIWQVKRPRAYVRKFTDYFSMMFISPVFFITAIVGIVSLQTMKVHNLLSPFLFLTVKILPIILLIVLFTMIFIVMPNTKVTLRAGFVGGIVTGTVFYLTQQVYILFQVGVSSNNAIYGGFAALPLFILWLQLSWLIVLFGAKISYATQNYEMYEVNSSVINISDYSRRILALLIVHKVIYNFNFGLRPLNSIELSQELHIPVRTVRVILQDLMKCRIVSEVVSEKTKLSAYQPAQNIDRFTIKYVMEQLDKVGDDYVLNNHTELTKKLIDIHENLFAAMETHSQNVLIKDL